MENNSYRISHSPYFLKVQFVNIDTRPILQSLVHSVILSL